jgi:hypothetical protein
MDTEGPGDCGSGVCTVEEANGVGDTRSGNITIAACRLNELYCMQKIKEGKCKITSILHELQC